MFYSHSYPILEFDDNPVAKINPESFVDSLFDTDKLIITFFPEVLESLAQEGRILPDILIGGENPIQIYRFVDRDVLITLGQLGCPACGGNLDLFHAMGVNRVMFCGGGGVLDRNIEVGTPLLVEGAIRDDGFSYHYLPADRVIYSDPKVVEKLARSLDARSVPYIRGLTWTTDAIFRETRDRVEARKQEGAKIVEMEQSACLAVAQVRGFAYGALIYGGDDVASDEWSERDWRSRKGIRYDLVMLCRDLVEEL